MRKTILATALIALATSTWAGDNFDGAGNIGSGGYSSGRSGDLFDHYFSEEGKRRNDAWAADFINRMLAPYDYEIARQKAMSRATVSIGWRGVSPGGFGSTKGNFGRSEDFSCSVRC